MSTALVRDRFALFAFRIEATPGVDPIAGSPIASDFQPGEGDFEYNPTIIANPEHTGTLDRAPGIPGGLRPRIKLRVALRGSGVAATPPDFSPLLQCCAMALTTTAAAVGVPTAATAGTISTATAAAPFVATANAYVGMPLSVTGDQVFNTGIISYSAARLIGMGEVRAAALTTSSMLQVPINHRYAPTSDESVYKTGVFYVYKDGYRWVFTGCVGTWSLEMNTGGMCFINFDFTGQLASVALAALPSGLGNLTIRPVAATFIAGKSRLNLAVARVRRLMFDAGVETTLPDNPEAAQGYDPGVPIARAMGGSMDPLMDTAGGTSITDAFRTGTNVPIMAMVGSTVGNRFVVVAPAARLVDVRHPARDGLLGNEIKFACDGPDAGLYLCAF
ncbi:hypothetical protein [Sandarakinorhabdus sp.]|uniref:hypothetical protein n=1 Tax=Sandarakinorhabdus sp. TaxID=1916663 RepID=UPI0035687527